MKISTLSVHDAARKQYIFVPLFQKEPLEKDELITLLPDTLKKILFEFAKKEFNGDDKEVKSLWTPEKRIVLFGLGDRAKWHYRKQQLLARRFVQYAKAEKIAEFAVPLKEVAHLRHDAQFFATNALMADFDYNVYKEKPQQGWPEIKNIFLVVKPEHTADAHKGIAEGMIIGEETNHCRTLSNTPGGDMTPSKLAQAAVSAGKRTNIKVKVLDEKAMEKLGMGGVLGVGRGSADKPRFIIMEYTHGGKKQKPLVLVGKGVTFDTGGLNLKPSDAIYEMHMDMSGGAAVIHGMAAIARLKLPINVVGLVPAVENMPSGSSYRPGDLLRTMSGKTIEVLDTDAEGRVILSDALYYGAQMKPGLMVDYATLTGAAHVALGSYSSALFTNRDTLINTFIAVGKTSGDYVWPFPLWDEYLSEIKGTFGDLANIGKGRRGGAIHGAKFLEQFVNDTPWAHLDIAPRMVAVEGDYLAKGAAGFGVRYSVELAKQYSEGEL